MPAGQLPVVAGPRRYNWPATDDQCESIDAGAGAGGTGGAGGGGTGGPAGGRLTVPGILAQPAGKITVKLVLPGPGVVSLRGAYRVGGRTVTVGRTTRRMSAAGSLNVALTLNAAGRRALRAHGKLKITITIAFSPSTGGRAVTVNRTVLLRAAASRIR